ncbi:MAG TPA: carbon-nitrogen hydrolase family protein [Lapillicoccus sp.]|nr:carbon-nitrogen hydrolase family protein [Lapillicoccus sp.]
MATVKVAAVQAAYVLMNQAACVAKAVDLLGQAAAEGCRIVVFPEVFVPGTPIWIDSRPIWDGDEEWFALLVDQAVVVPGPVTEALGAAARDADAYLVIGVEEREPHGSTIYNTTLYFGPRGDLLGTHRKLMPTGSERTVWGMGDGSTLPVIDTEHGRLSGLTCWENYMPLARFYLYAQGVDIWAAPTLAGGDAWVATMRHIAREGRCYVIGVNPCLHVDQIPADFPNRAQVWRHDQEDNEWVEAGNSVIVGPGGELLAGPVRHEETILTAEIDLGAVRAARRLFDPVGHYNRPDVFQLSVDTRHRAPVVLEQEREPAGGR